MEIRKLYKQIVFQMLIPNFRRKKLIQRELCEHCQCAFRVAHIVKVLLTGFVEHIINHCIQIVLREFIKSKEWIHWM